MLRGRVLPKVAKCLPVPSCLTCAFIPNMVVVSEPNAQARAVSDAVRCRLAGTAASATTPTPRTDVTDANAGGAGRAPTVK